MKKGKNISVFAGIFLLASFLLSGCVGIQEPQQVQPEKGLELTILHTNDTHSHVAGINKYGNACFSDEKCLGGMSRISKTIANAKEKNDNIIALDAGDQFQGTLFYSVNKWKIIRDINRFMPYDAMTLGNHEFDEGCQELVDFLKETSFPVVAANLAPAEGCPLHKKKLPAYIIKEVRGIKVGIIGIANDEVKELASACPHTHFHKSSDTISRVVKELESQGVKHIIALTHIGLPADKELARQSEGVDVIVGGHTHSYLGLGAEDGPYPIVEKSKRGEPVLVVTAKSAARYLGELNLVFDSNGVLTSWNGKAKELTQDMEGNPDIVKLVGKYSDTLESYRKTVVGSHDLHYLDGMDFCRKGDCLSGMIAVDAVLEYARPYGATIAMINGGGIRASFPPGKITRGDLLTVLPFGGSFVLRQYTGEQLLKALEHGVAEEKGQGPRLLQVAGLRYVVSPSKPVGKRILKVEVLDQAGNAKPLNLKATYKVVLPEYISKGGDGYTVFKDGIVLSSPDALDVTIVEAYFKKHSPLPMPKTGRIIWK